jgi:hypothetical protein
VTPTGASRPVATGLQVALAGSGKVETGLISVAVGAVVGVWLAGGRGVKVGLAAGVVETAAVAKGNGAVVMLGVSSWGALLQAANMPAAIATPPRKRVRRKGIIN